MASNGSQTGSIPTDSDNINYIPRSDQDPDRIAREEEVPGSNSDPGTAGIRGSREGGGEAESEGEGGHGPAQSAPMYHRPAGVVSAGGHPVFIDTDRAPGSFVLSAHEMSQSLEAERELLLDNGLMKRPRSQRGHHDHDRHDRHDRHDCGRLGGDDHGHLEENDDDAAEKKRRSFAARIRQSLAYLGAMWPPRRLTSDEERSETSTLLPSDGDGDSRGGGGGYGTASARLAPARDGDESRDISERWDAAVAEGRIRTTWWREAVTLTRFAGPLMMSYMMQQSLQVTSLVAVGKIGRIELGAVSLATMTSAMVFNAPIAGLATSLDTLCAQAYGSGSKHLVGLQMQRMILFLSVVCIPVWVVMYFSPSLLGFVVPDPRSAELAGRYLRILMLGTPGIILFESGKRFVQAQGLFRSTVYAFALAAPVNILLNWLLVWRLGLGFVGAPLAVAVSQLMLPLALFAYVRFVDGMQCWGGFSVRAFTNWGHMIRLAIPGMLQVWAEWIAFEVLAVLSSQFGDEYLAAHTVMGSMVVVSYMVPLSFGVATSTRVANWIGAGMVDAAKVTVKTASVGIWLIILVICVCFGNFSSTIARAFTDDAEVLFLIDDTSLILAVLCFWDAIASLTHSVLRALGRQRVGGIIAVLTHWIIGLPLAVWFGFGLGWKLKGLWAGLGIALCATAVGELIYILYLDWHRAAREAAVRNAAN